MTSPISQYMETLAEMQMKYGQKKTCVLIHVGSFYEMYGINSDDVIFPIASLLRIIVTKKNKNISNVSKSNPYMAGFTKSALNKYLNILLENNFTVIQIDQIERDENSSIFKREISRIVSPSTALSCTNFDNPKSSSMILLYVENNKNGICCGLVNIDLSTNDVIVREIFDEEEIINIIQNNISAEIVVVGDFKLTCDILFKKIEINKEMEKIDYQSKLLDIFYGNSSMLTIIEYLNLEFLSLARIALCYALNYMYEHDKRIMYSLSKPKIYNDSDKLKLSNFALQQLQITKRVNHGNSDSQQCRIQSLECIVNKCLTSFGRREMTKRISEPITSVNTLRNRYNKIDYFLVNNEKLNLKEISMQLNNIKDLEKLHRRLVIGFIKPFELNLLISSYMGIVEVSKILNISSDSIWEFSQLALLNDFINEYNKSIISNLGEDIKFRESFDDEYDNLISEREDILRKMNVDVTLLNKLMETKINKKKQLKLDYNDKLGYFIKTTKIRGNMINSLKDGLILFNVGNVTRIKTNNLAILSDRMIVINEKIEIRAKIIYDELLIKLSKLIPFDTVRIITEIDISLCASKIAFQNRYCCPEIKTDGRGSSYVDAIDLRHPISEMIHTDTLYTPNDIVTSVNKKGMIVTGCNGAGKSLYLKSIAVSIIMAQSGLYVPASSFKYIPFEFLMTRIGNGDNLLRGHSTFVCEMNQLRQILKTANSKSLIIMDELCSGSEVVSAKSILASTILYLIKKKSCFIASTHIHGLESIIPKDLITFGYMEVLIRGDDIIYSRKLKTGVSDILYGLEVCKHLIDDDNFISTAVDIRNKISGYNLENIIQTKRSRYNTKIIVDKCEICGVNKGLDVHHINFQCTSDLNGFIDNFHKNKKGNLVVLCKKHHDQIHNGNLNVYGWKKSAKLGNFLDFQVIGIDDKIN